MSHPASEMRAFNRFYTRAIGLLSQGYLDSAFGLSEVRVLYELARRDGLMASNLVAQLGLDPAHLSRMLAGFERKGLLRRARADGDGRARVLALTAAGRRVIRDLDARSDRDIGALLTPLSPASRARLLGAMRVIRAVLGDGDLPAPAIRLRLPRPGDLAHVVHRQTMLYHAEYGWNNQYEALTCEIVSTFIRTLDPARERCWIADCDGDIVGAVFLVRHPEHADVAKLRMLHVEASMRGRGLGRRLVRACTTFARASGYRKITLWTNSVLTAARALYKSEGYVLVHSAPQPNFGRDLVGETWELVL